MIYRRSLRSCNGHPWPTKPPQNISMPMVFPHSFLRSLLRQRHASTMGRWVPPSPTGFRPTNVASECGQDPRHRRRNFDGSKWCIWRCCRQLAHIPTFSREFECKRLPRHDCWSIVPSNCIFSLKVFQVEKIRRKSDTSLWTVHTSAGSRAYKGVILAAPFHQTDISLPSDLAELIPPQPYVHLHVTWLTTRSERPRPEYFGLASNAQVPKMILSTHEGARLGGIEPEFNSISYHGKVRKFEQGEAGDELTDPEWTVKIFSKERVSDEWLETVFGSVGWVYRKLVSRFCPH